MAGATRRTANAERTLAAWRKLLLTAHWGLMTYWWVVIKLAVTVVLTPLVIIIVLVPRLDAAVHSQGSAGPSASDEDVG